MRSDSPGKLVVIDTNILVSALWSPNGIPAKILGYLGEIGRLIPCYDRRIMAEYVSVLNRPKFHFDLDEVNVILEEIRKKGWLIIEPANIDRIPGFKRTQFPDPDDIKFVEVAYATGAPLVTGNLKHFPGVSFAKTAKDFLSGIEA
ncbi:MAG: putative toxin-antitoxin system toxin component, PIN family [Mobiluncus porci]|uniref:putative toxin-antitoxin system toxin component, PIN family n=1 Tax=Mobiluncus porci TaxID=2652278 RepID=UPI0023EFF7E9|nr:putative toxin-antitoxin system toxin component, PIN family [Mobiluncus porci]MDD7542276.1 putative toxin-antitoxin system toxin component, PIN family [Mobiluncus porci]MDY5749075.1 putative toxin-antitoxin system toxin component, PIN family [Mobiluncus porci]